MNVRNAGLTVLKVYRKQGDGKNGKPYDFHTARVIDDEGEVFTLNLAKTVVDSIGSEKLLEFSKVGVIADISITAKGYDLKGQIEALTPKE